MTDQEARLKRIKAPIEQSAYDIDVQLLDRYVAFSAEILRLALALLTALGFGASLLLSKPNALPVGLLKNCYVALPLIVGVLVLGITVALALAHRFIACEGFFYHAVALRRAVFTSVEGDAEAIEQLNLSREQYKRAERYLRLSAIGLAVGAGLLILGCAAYLIAI